MNIKKTWNKKILLWVVCFFFLWLIFSLTAYLCLDPDFGWHLKTGEWVWLNKAVPKTDLFSYTMPDYPWVAHSWSLDVLLFLGLNRFGYAGLALLSGLFGSLTLMILVKAKDIFFSIFPLLLVGLSCLEYVSVRPRMASFFLTVVLFLILRRSFKNLFWLFLLPPFFWLWVNLHAGFSLGFALVFLLVLLDGLFIRQARKEAKKHFFIVSSMLILSIFLGLINPYSQGIYRLIFEEMVVGQQVHYRIAEWMPYSSFNLSMMAYTSFLAALVVIYLPFRLPGLGIPILPDNKKNKKDLGKFWNRQRLFELALSLTFLIAGFLSRRLMIYYYFFSFPLLVSLLKETYLRLKNKKKFRKIWPLHKILLLIGLIYALVFLRLFYQGISHYSEEKYYPVLAINFIKDQNISGNLYSTYNWGGYLVWKMPEKKVYVDGRMAIWRQGDYSAFTQQIDLETGEVDYQEIFEKHQITHVLLATRKNDKISLFRIILEIFGFRKRVVSFEEKLFLDGWEIAYWDEIARVLVNPQGGKGGP